MSLRRVRSSEASDGYRRQECELTLAFVGKDRYKVYHAFNEYVRQGYHRYFDNKRLNALIFFVSESIEPSEEIWKGSVPYIQVTYKLRSIKGHALTYSHA